MKTFLIITAFFMMSICMLSAQQGAVAGGDSTATSATSQRRGSTFMNRIRSQAPAPPKGMYRSLDSALLNVDSVEVLILRNQELTQIPPQVANMKRLKTIDLSGNKLTAFPDALLKLPNVYSLDLSNNPIKSLPAGIASLQRLSKLNLKNTGITTLPAALGQCKELMMLDVSANPLVSLPVAELNALPKLKQIQIGKP